MVSDEVLVTEDSRGLLAVNSSASSASSVTRAWRLCRRLIAAIGEAQIYSMFAPRKIFPTEELQSFMPKRTFQPNRRHRSKTHGFRTRMKTKSGQAVLSRRRAKGRKRVAVKPGFRE